MAVEVKLDKAVDMSMLDFHPERVGDNYRIYTTEPHEVIRSIVGFATLNGLKILSLNVQSPSLEDVFVKLIGGSNEQ